MVNANFINECKNRANANRLGKLIVDGLENPITQSDKLQSFSIDDGCYVDGNIIGSIYVKKLTSSLLDTNELNLVDKEIEAQTGVKYADSSTDYIKLGKYIVERPKDEQTANMSQITAYEKLKTNLDNKYVCGIDYTSGDITLEDLYLDVCVQLDLTPVTTEFDNNDIPILDNPFKAGETNRTVLQTVAKIGGYFVDVDYDTNKIDLKWLSQSEEPDYEFETSDYAELDGGKIVCGPINTLIIKNSQIDDENVTITDDESIALYGENSITISEDYILYNEQLRNQAITAIWQKVNGLTYTDCKLTTYYGKPFLKIGGKIRINKNDNGYFDTYVLNHNFTYDGTFKSVIESPALTKQEIKTKQPISLKEKLYETTINVDKQKGEIESLTRRVLDVEDETGNMYTKEDVDRFFIDAKTGVTNTFSTSGGNNIFRNTGLWFETGDQYNPYEFWNGIVAWTEEKNAQNMGALLLQIATVSQEQQVANGKYTVSFKYKKLIEPAIVKCTINNIEYTLSGTDETEFEQTIDVNSQYINVQFSSDITDSCKIYDLMVNSGEVKLAYTQNQNETTTDTVNISKGITITSSNSKTTFKATADGIRTLDENGNTLTEFTDVGMTNKTQIIEEQATIVSLLHKRVGNHVWVSKI